MTHLGIEPRPPVCTRSLKTSVRFSAADAAKKEKTNDTISRKVQKIPYLAPWGKICRIVN